MNRFLLVLMVLVLCVVGIGFYSGWWTVTSSSPDADSNQVDINLSVDPDKVRTDAEAVQDKATELTDQAKKDANDLVDRARDKKEPTNDE